VWPKISFSAIGKGTGSNRIQPARWTAAVILKGASPGAALVFLLVGPATNMAALTVLVGTLGKRSTAVYLAAIALCAVLFGLALDGIYTQLGFSAQAVVGQHTHQVLPPWLCWGGAGLLGLLSVPPLARRVKNMFTRACVSPAAAPMTVAPDSGMPNKSTTDSACGST
jgi:hypothetical protein